MNNVATRRPTETASSVSFSLLVVLKLIFGWKFTFEQENAILLLMGQIPLLVTWLVNARRKPAAE